MLGNHRRGYLINSTGEGKCWVQGRHPPRKCYLSCEQKDKLEFAQLRGIQAKLAAYGKAHSQDGWFTMSSTRGKKKDIGYGDLDSQADGLARATCLD